MNIRTPLLAVALERLRDDYADATDAGQFGG